MARQSSDPRIAYIDHVFGKEPAGFEQVRAEGEKRRPGMQVSAAEGKILGLLVTLKQPKHILEVGCFMGYSTLSMARHLPQGGRITTLEYDKDYAAQARKHFDALDANKSISLVEGAALESIAALPKDARFDMVFIDAMKKEYLDYLLAVEPHLNQGALVIADNSFLFGNVYLDAPGEGTSREAWEAMRALNTRLADDALYHGVMLPTPEGMTVAIKK